MGDEADAISEWAICGFGVEFIPDHYENARNRIWLTKDGDEIEISQMKTSHINNSINMIERRNLSDMYCYIEPLKLELLLRKF